MSGSGVSDPADTVTVFVDTVGVPWTRSLAGRRMVLRALFPLSVFRFEVCKSLDSLPPERARLWLLQPDVGEVLVDLSRTAAENRIVNGSRMLLEVAAPDGSWTKSAGATFHPKQAAPDASAPAREPSMASAPVSATGGAASASLSERAVAAALAETLRTVQIPSGLAGAAAVPPSHHHPQQSPPHHYQQQPPPPQQHSQPHRAPHVSAEEAAVQAAMAASGAAQRSDLAREERLQLALAMQQLKARKVRDDGDCLFHALADQLHSDANRHAELRAAVCAELLNNRAHYEPFVAEDFDSYAAVMACAGVYGTHLEIQAFANLFQKQVLVYSDADDGQHDGVLVPISIAPASGAPQPPALRITHQRGNHYNSIVDINDGTDDARGLDAGAAAAVAPGGVRGTSCPYCALVVDDVDLHLVTAHADMF